MTSRPVDPTLGASYVRAPGSGFGTQLDPAPIREMLPAWKKAVAVVMPMGCGKSTAVANYGGYDIDDLVVNAGELACDTEFEELLQLRQDGVFYGDASATHKHNKLMHVRARRALSTVHPDSNPLVIYCHTVEFATSLGLPVVLSLAVTPACYDATERAKGEDGAVKAVTIRTLEAQTASNAEYFRRHPEMAAVNKVCSTYSEVDARVKQNMERMGLWQDDTITQAFGRGVVSNLKATIDLAYRVVRNRSPRHMVPVAARFLVECNGDAAPQEAHNAHNHHHWSRIVHAAFSNAGGDCENPPLTEDAIKEVHPYGPGHSSFALFKVTDWLKRTPTWQTDPAWIWFRQAFGRVGVSYEKLASLLAMGDCLSYVWPEECVHATKIPLGSLTLEGFFEVCQSIHNIARISCTFMGKRLEPKQLSVYLYWHCLAGRLNTGVDLDAEIADRTSMGTPKKFFKRNRWSEREYDKRFDAAVSAAYDQLANVNAKRVARAAEVTKTFDSFMEHRRDWVRAGSSTGAPKTDLVLDVPASKLADLDGLTEVVGTTGLHIVRNLRLNKAAAFEFREIVDITKAALDKLEPNAFTRYFPKHEAGKAEGRALYPANTLHYIMVSHVLYIAEKGGPMDGTRLMSDSDQQMDDHWWWRQTREFCIGLMLDYANFNEQHSIKHMQSVIDRLRRFYGRFAVVSPDLDFSIRWVCDSFDNIVFESDGQLIPFLHGLLSGMRNTSFTNNVMNLAYLSTIAQQVYELTGETVLVEKQTGGDDVAADVNSVYHACLVIRVGALMGFVFKDVKQLLSSRYHEFFRLIIAEEGVYGSICRMLGSATSGQWSNSVIAKFVEPAAKISSVIEVARKAGRRAELNMTFMEKICACAFDKWATAGEHSMLAEYIHGTKETGGLGIARVDGTIFELEGVVPDKEEQVRIVDVPNDASLVKAKQLVADAQAYVGVSLVVPAVRLANAMAESVFKGALATSRGPGKAQKAFGRKMLRPPRVVRIKQVLRSHTARAHEFGDAYNRHKAQIEAYRAAGARYAALSIACTPEGREVLAKGVCAEYANVDHRKVMHWKDKLTLYGCATYLLTEDYYEQVQVLSVVQSSSPSDESVSRLAGYYASGLANDGYMYY